VDAAATERDDQLPHRRDAFTLGDEFPDTPTPVRSYVPHSEEARLLVDSHLLAAHNRVGFHADIAGFEPASPGLTVQCSTN
jgi:hypothetical protein